MREWQVRKGITFDVHWCSDLDTFLDRLKVALQDTQNAAIRPFIDRKTAMQQEVIGSFVSNGICGFVDLKARVYYVCVQTDQATIEAFNDMTQSVLDAYPPMLAHTRPLPRFMSDEQTQLLQAPHKLFLDSVGYEIFKTTT